MSYDCWMAIDTGGPELVNVCDIGNYTSNVGDMWRDALGCSLADLHGKPGGDCIAILEAGVSNMRHPDNAERYRSMNPKNGWGNHDGAAAYLEDILCACRDHPKATLTMWY